MTPQDRASLTADLMLDEGTGPMRHGRLFPYFDCCGQPFRQCQCVRQGKLTIGFGRNIEDRGLSMPEAQHLLDNDIDDTLVEQGRTFPWSGVLNGVRQRVLANMLFNLGLTKLQGFTHTLTAMRERRYRDAAEGMRASKWYRQVGKRGERLAQEMETGEDA